MRAGKKQIFVHGGLDRFKQVDTQSVQDVMWDRTLIQDARANQRCGIDHKYFDYDDIFLGHTSTQNFQGTEPMHCCNVWNLDTGAGWSGKLTIMDTDTKQYWQSDVVGLMLYPEQEGR